MLPQQYCLKWKYHNTNIQFTFAQLLEKGSFCDVTLWCGGCAFRAHRAVLASCSGLLATLLDSHEPSSGEPAIVLDRTEPMHLRQLLAFMYTGEVSVHHTELAGLLKTAEELKIKGLAEVSWKDSASNNKYAGSDGARTSLPAAAAGTAAAGGAPSGPVTPVDPLLTDIEELHPVQPIMIAVNGSLVVPPMNMNQTSVSMSQIPINMSQSSINMSQTTVNLSQTPINMSQTPINMSQSAINMSQTPINVEAVKRRRGRPPLEPKMPLDSEVLTPHSSPKRVKIHTSTPIIAKPPQEEPQIHLKEVPIEWSSPQSGNKNDDSEELSSEYSEASLDGRDISQFLDTTMEVEGAAPTHSPAPAAAVQMVQAPKVVDPVPPAAVEKATLTTASDTPPPAVPPQFADVVKLSDYLVRGRRPQFWAEDYVKRVMEAVFCKELEMKQAAEMLGVSYGTLYGRYRDCFGCINRPYRVQDFWTEQGRSEILTKLQRKDISLFKAAEMLNVTPQTLSSYLNTIDPTAAIKEETSSPHSRKSDEEDGKSKDNYQGCSEEDDPSDAESDDGSVHSDDEKQIKANTIEKQKSSMSKTPAIRVVNLKFLKGDTVEGATSGESVNVTQLLKNHPDLTMTATKRKVHFQEVADIINPKNGDDGSNGNSSDS